MRLLKLALFAALALSSNAAAGQALINGVPVFDGARVAEIVQGQMPPVCDQPPAPDATAATAGAAQPCTPRSDAARQTQVPPATATTAADGMLAGNWDNVLPRAPTKGVAVIFGTQTPYHCQLATLTTTGFTGKCWALVPTTLPGVPASLLGLVVSPVANPAAGLTVHVFARY